MAEKEEAADDEAAAAEVHSQPTKMESDDESMPDIDVDLESEDGYEKLDPVGSDGEGVPPSSPVQQPPASEPSEKKPPKKEEKNGAADKPKRRKAMGGMQLPEFWPWEQAKELFIHPDVLPANEVEVRAMRGGVKGVGLTGPLARSSSGPSRTSRGWSTSWSGKRDSSGCFVAV